MIDIAIDILEQAANGNMEAFEKVYKAAGSFVYNVAFRITRNSADADEVTQDVFMKVFHNLKNFQFRSTFKTWIYRITVNTAINRYRKSTREERGRTDYDSVKESISGGCSTRDGAVQGDNEIRLNALLNMLSLEHRTCLIMREIEGLTYQEISEALKIPINTVRSRLKRARQALLGWARKEPVKNAL